MKRLNVGDQITIRASGELERGGKAALANRKGVVKRILSSNGHTLGAFIETKVFRRNQVFFIPLCSIEVAEEVDRLRNLNILKSTIL